MRSEPELVIDDCVGRIAEVENDESVKGMERVSNKVELDKPLVSQENPA